MPKPYDSSHQDVLIRLRTRLHTRRAELEQTVLEHVDRISVSTELVVPDYTRGLHAAVTASVAYGFAVIAHVERRPPPVPNVLLANARASSRAGVPIETLVRRYCAGYTILVDTVVTEALQDPLVEEGTLTGVLRSHMHTFDGLLEVIADEHTRESKATGPNGSEHRVARVRELLAGADPDLSDLDYRFRGWHVGLIARGSGSAETVRDLSSHLGSQLLSIPAGDATTWAWLGGTRPLDPQDTVHSAKRLLPKSISLAIGEPCQGPIGWKLTHRQALAALSVTRLEGQQSIVRYADVALLASIFQDDVLKPSLRQMYFSPLGDNAKVRRRLIETLGAYVTAERNISSAAAILGVNRRTVSNRLQMIEERLNRPLHSAMPGIEAALLLDSANAFDDI